VDLFSTSKNILPFDGEAEYHGPIMSLSDAQHYFNALLNDIEWMNDQANIFGKLIITKRKVAWYGEESFNYTYSNTTKSALPWTKELLELKELCEKESGETYNSCLLNLYHSGEEGMAWHSDGEKDLKRHGAIGSLSLGAERKFAFKHKSTKQKVDVYLEKGSLLVMKGRTQENWLHRLPPTRKVLTPRINLTFRTIDNT
jgi:alkylated DNA repair dioxygenase AlkB